MLTGDNRSNEPDQEDLQTWADNYDMVTVPVLQLPEEETNWQTWSGLGFEWEQDLYIPSFWVLGPDMTIIAVDEQYPSDPGRYLE